MRAEFDYTEWPTPRLVEEFTTVQSSLEQIAHTAERRAELEQRVSHIVFELAMRETDASSATS